MGIEGLAVAAVALEQGGDRVVDSVTTDESAVGVRSAGGTPRRSRVTPSPSGPALGPHPVRLVWHKRRWRGERPCAREGRSPVGRVSYRRASQVEAHASEADQSSEKSLLESPIRVVLEGRAAADNRTEPQAKPNSPMDGAR